MGKDDDVKLTGLGELLLELLPPDSPPLLMTLFARELGQLVEGAYLRGRKDAAKSRAPAKSISVPKKRARRRS